jgi:hypothetical protein
LAEQLKGLLKFFLGLAVLPAVAGVSGAFYQQLGLGGIKDYKNYLLWGIVIYMVCHLLVCRPRSLYGVEHRIFRGIFRAGSGIVRFLPLLSILLFIAFWIISKFSNPKVYLDYFLFLLGFSFALHIVNAAEDLRSEEIGILSSGYLFLVSLVYIASIVILILILDFLFPKVSFHAFLTTAYQITEQAYVDIWSKASAALWS